MPGVVKLIQKSGRYQKSRYEAKYYNKMQMRSIIELWRSMLADKFENYFVHAIPRQ